VHKQTDFESLCRAKKQLQNLHRNP